jgi:hypothetical protein
MYSYDPDDLLKVIVFEKTVVFNTTLDSITLDSINNSLIYISNSLDIIYLNIILFLFLVSCILFTKKKNKEYITLEPKITHGTIAKGTIISSTIKL